MMSLSNNLRKITDKVESWLRYEMESFEPYGEQENRKKDFISLKSGIDKKSEFIPLEALKGTSGEASGCDDVSLGKHEKIDRLEQEAYEKGFAQGEKDGFELGEKKANKVIENIEKLLKEISRFKKDVLKEYEKEILDLIFAVVEKIVYHEVRRDDTAIKESIFDALEMAVEKSKVIFNVNPDDYEYVEKLRPDLFRNNKDIKSIVVTSDPAVSRGGCFLETHRGNIDATIESKLEKIRQCFQEAMG
jgi:flagellar biosynthesis/type III secretory pathway protein FliH